MADHLDGSCARLEDVHKDEDEYNQIGTPVGESHMVEEGKGLCGRSYS